MCYADNEIIKKRNRISKIMMSCFIIALVLSLYSIFHPLLYDMLGYIKNGVSLVSLGLGSFAISFVIYSLKTSYDSDTKMIQNANVNFLQALSDFEKARIKFLNPRNNQYFRYTPEAFTWRSRTHLERATELEKKMIKEKHHHKLIHYFNMSYNALLCNSYNYNDLDNPTKGNVREMYKIARQYHKGDHETEFNQVLENIGKDPNETEEEFYNRLFPPEQTKT